MGAAVVADQQLTTIWFILYINKLDLELYCVFCKYTVAHTRIKKKTRPYSGENNNKCEWCDGLVVMADTYRIAET